MKKEYRDRLAWMIKEYPDKKGHSYDMAVKMYEKHAKELKIDLEEFVLGFMYTEFEHFRQGDSSNLALIIKDFHEGYSINDAVALITIAHIEDICDYYTRLMAMKEIAGETEQE